MLSRCAAQKRSLDQDEVRCGRKLIVIRIKEKKTWQELKEQFAGFVAAKE